jgi:hypothetical protein
VVAPGGSLGLMNVHMGSVRFLGASWDVLRAVLYIWVDLWARLGAVVGRPLDLNGGLEVDKQSLHRHSSWLK